MALLSISNDIDETVAIECHTFESPELCNKFLKSTNYNLKILSFNVRSIQCNFDKFAISLQRIDSDVDVIVLTECWLSEDSIIDCLPGYNAFRSVTQMNKSGGVVTYVKSTYTTVVSFPVIKDADSMLVTINENIAVLGIYRSPSTASIEPLINSLDIVLDSLRSISVLLVTGDLNIDICNPSKNQVPDYLCLMASHSLLPAISMPTRSKACYDHIFIKCPSKSSGLVCKSSITDHDIDDPIVTVKQGQLQGSILKLLNDSPYFSFKGIPYAQPPVGDLRFKAPLPPTPWSGIRNATEHGSYCTQYDMNTNQILNGSEDCLFLNVYTKSLHPHAKIPVMVYIHGGAFMSGSGDTDTYGPEFLIQHDVILVTMNYRLEVLGFLCLDTPEVPGNAGM
ncbi:Carboxylesterase CXE23, partial [Operophtera brumata]